jgi:hypothetical protein
LQIGRAILFRIKATAVDIARPPEQQVASEVDEIVLHKVRPFVETKGGEGFPEYTLGCVDRPKRVSSLRYLVEYIGKYLREGSYLVPFIRDEADLLRAPSDRMGPRHSMSPPILICASGTVP